MAIYRVQYRTINGSEEYDFTTMDRAKNMKFGLMTDYGVDEYDISITVIKDEYKEVRRV